MYTLIAWLMRVQGNKMNYPPKVMITEVGPRDGLQNESVFVPTQIKIDFINELSKTGLRSIEVTSFVSDKAIPQLADNTAVFSGIDKPSGIEYSALIPNKAGMENAIKAGLKNIAVFTAASNTFTQHNINCTIAESLKRFQPVFELAKAHHIPVRAYVSCALGCPYEGKIDPLKVAEVSLQLLELGANEICLGDTIGVGTPRKTETVIHEVLKLMPAEKIAMHFHDTYGQALTNIYASLQSGITHFDSSVAGLGGCPYAKGATGNVASEDVLYLMEGLGIETGIDLGKMIAAGQMICRTLKKTNQSKVAIALAEKS